MAGILTAAMVAVLTAAASAVLARWLMAHAAALGLQDVPNHRSSHVGVTPRGGGAAIVLASSLGALLLAVSPLSTATGIPATGVRQAAAGLPAAWWAAGGGCLMLAGVGLADDLRSLSQRFRLSAQALTAALIVWAAASTTSYGDDWPAGAGWALAMVAVVGGVWWVNLFNFMDGIDGIASCEALFLLSCALLMHPGFGSGAQAMQWCAWLLLAAVVGFLPLNWRPARIFLGDCGSLFLGVAIFLLATHGVTQGHTHAWFWLIVTGAFVSDTTVTLFRRLIAGIDVTSAHRSHLYQRLARRWGDHAKVTLVYSAANLAWFLPLALMSNHWPGRGLELTIAAYLPAVVVCWWFGAGTPDAPAAGNLESVDSERDGEPGPVTTKP